MQSQVDVLTDNESITEHSHHAVAQERLGYADEKLRSIQSYAAFCTGHGAISGPLDVFLEVSNVCNLKCAMCGQFSALNPNKFKLLKEQDRGFLDTDNILGNIEQALKGALLVHCFGFGEPTIHPSFRDLINIVHRHAAMSDFYTNGMHLDQDMCEFLVDRGVYQIIVSFSGATKAVYENIYIGGNFERVLAGIKRLSTVKAARNSRYPIIHVNSIGFRDHIADFDKFVELMAHHGVNNIILNQLSVQPSIPHLYEHVSIMRPEQEGVIIERAKLLAKELGVSINANAYARHSVASEEDYVRQQLGLRDTVENILGRQNRSFGNNPITEFREIAKGLTAIPDPSQEKTVPSIVALDTNAAIARSVMGIDSGKTEVNADTFYCLEPFKTMYITRNGPAKPCCFATSGTGSHAFLGNTKTENALNVWQGQAYKSTREAISEGKYPNFCNLCLKNKSAPSHSIISLVESYMSWHEAQFGAGLRDNLNRNSPDALRAIREAQPHQIMAAFRAFTDKEQETDRGA